MNVAVVVGQLALFAVADEASERAEHPNPDAPLRHQSQTDGHVDGHKPDVASKSVEDASPAGLLSRHACQLSVGAVVEIRPDEQQNTDDGVSHVVEIEHHASCRTEEDGKNRHHIGVYAKEIKEISPKQAQWAREMYVEPFFGVLRLEGGRQFLFSAMSLYF